MNLPNLHLHHSPIFPGRDTGERLELATEMKCIAVAEFCGDFRHGHFRRVEQDCCAAEALLFPIMPG